MREGLLHGRSLVAHSVLGNVARRVSMPHLLLDHLRLAELTSMPAVRGRNSVALRCRVLVLILPWLGLLLPRPGKNDWIVLACGDTVPSIFHD